jgi:hypothetical protein
MSDSNLQEWILLKARGEVPREIAEFMQQCFQIMEIRAKVGMAKGIVFEVRTRETNHIVPHIHASYDSYSISIEIETGKVFAGKLPKKQQSYAVQWVADHKMLLLDKWRDIAITAVSHTTKSALDMNN